MHKLLTKTGKKLFFLCAILVGCSDEKTKKIIIDDKHYLIPQTDIIVSSLDVPFYHLYLKGKNDKFRIVYSDKNERANETSPNSPTVAYINDGKGQDSHLREIDGLQIVCNHKAIRWNCGTVFEQDGEKWAVIFPERDINNARDIVITARKQISSYRRG